MFIYLLKNDISIWKAICIFFLFYELKYGLTSSVLLFLFWASLLISASFMFRSNIYKYINAYDQINWLEFVLFYEFYGLILLMFVLSFFSERSFPISENAKNSLYDELVTSDFLYSFNLNSADLNYIFIIKRSLILNQRLLFFLASHFGG